MHPVTTFSEPTSTSSVSERGITVVRHFPAKLWELLKFDFRLCTLRRKTPDNHFSQPKNFKVFTNGSRDDNYRSGSGIYIKTQDHILRIQRRNPDGCSVFRGSLAHGFTRQDQTLLARFRSGHIKSMKLSEGRKNFEMCTNCSSEPGTCLSPAHQAGHSRRYLAGVGLSESV
ncbi:hypothetical protein TNCV_2848871 [Trichonephila clavipes]|nr:hypothetical protein TNCV_2848871 [Trichonephila clavipes]